MKYFGAEVIGHRGAAGLRQENTRKAFEWACEHLLNWVETDIRCSSDGRLVIIHNSHIQEHVIVKTSYRELFDLSGGNLMLLDELLQDFGSKLNLNLEIKDPACAEAAMKAVQGLALEGRVLFSSFSHPVVHKMTAMRSACRFAPLIASRPTNIRTFLEGFPGLDLIVADCDFCDQDMVRTCRDEGFELFLYNVHDPQGVKTLIEAGVTGIIVDRPDLFIEQNL